MKATTDFTSARLGNVSKGDPIPNDEYGQHLLRQGLAKADYKTKVVEEKPEAPKPAKKKAKKKVSG